VGQHLGHVHHTSIYAALSIEVGETHLLHSVDKLECQNVHTMENCGLIHLNCSGIVHPLLTERGGEVWKQLNFIHVSI
jgi:hypothetical protein